MTLDLDELTTGWECPPGELRARVIVGRDGEEMLQLRVDLGVMQMELEGRPDGLRYRGLPSTREYIEHELRVGGEQLSEEDWEELERELLQANYRRMAYSAVADEALHADSEDDARRYIEHALNDISHCLANLRLMDREPTMAGGYPALRPTLVFDQARLAAQLQIVEGQFEDAVEQAEQGVQGLDTLLTELGYDEEQREQDPGIRYLQGLSRQLRTEYGITRTLVEQLEEALEDEDYETAAGLRDQLERRKRKLPPQDEEGADEE